jgi:hypothetical protein
MELAADILKHNLVEYNVNNFFATVRTSTHWCTMKDG